MLLIAFIQQLTSESLHVDIDRAIAAPCLLVRRERVKIVLHSKQRVGSYYTSQDSFVGCTVSW